LICSYDREWIIRLGAAGWGSRKIAEEVGCGKTTVNQVLIQYGNRTRGDLRLSPKTIAEQAREVRSEAISEVTWWARRCTKLDWQALQERLQAIEKPDLWWKRRRDWTIGQWAEYALRHSV